MDSGAEPDPGGFHLIRLPFADDIREARFEEACRGEQSILLLFIIVALTRERPLSPFPHSGREDNKRRRRMDREIENQERQLQSG